MIYTVETISGTHRHRGGSIEAAARAHALGCISRSRRTDVIPVVLWDQSATPFWQAVRRAGSATYALRLPFKVSEGVKDA